MMSDSKYVDLECRPQANASQVLLYRFYVVDNCPFDILVGQEDVPQPPGHMKQRKSAGVSRLVTVHTRDGPPTGKHPQSIYGSLLSLDSR